MNVVIPKFNGMQIEAIIDKLVPLIAEPQDPEFFRGALWIKAENSGSAAFTAFAAKLLNKVAA